MTASSPEPSPPEEERAIGRARRHGFRKIADWLGTFSEQAMRESTFLVDKVVHRF